MPLAAASHDVHVRTATFPVEQVLGDADCVLVDAASLDPLAIARRVHQVDADVQVVVVAESEERRRALASGVLFTPGVGGIWIASPADVTGAIAEREIGRAHV